MVRAPLEAKTEAIFYVGLLGVSLVSQVTVGGVHSWFHCYGTPWGERITNMCMENTLASKGSYLLKWPSLGWCDAKQTINQKPAMFNNPFELYRHIWYHWSDGRLRLMIMYMRPFSCNLFIWTNWSICNSSNLWDFMISTCHGISITKLYSDMYIDGY